MSLLAVNGLRIRYGDSEVVSGLSFSVESGESLGLVGESGSGKTQTALAILGLLPATAALEGSITVDGTEVVVAEGFADAYRQFVENGWQTLPASPEYDGMGLPDTVASASFEMWQSANVTVPRGCGAITRKRSVTESPGVSASTMKAESPRDPGASPVRAMTV